MFNTFSKTDLSGLDLSVLTDMLAKLTLEYVKCRRQDGISAHAGILKEYIDNIQLAIDHKRSPIGGTLFSN